MKKRTTRRQALQHWLAVTSGGVGLLMTRGSEAQELTLTPSCGAGDAPTPAGTEGPFFTAGAPKKADFRADATGERLTLFGFVVARDCKPLANVRVDLWHADSNGEYDNEGYRLRGHQLTDAQGRYAFETIVPAAYDRRTRHYHLKLQPPGGRLLTTQLYFPGEKRNDNDFLFDRHLLMKVENASDGKVGRFDFVLES